MLLGIQAKKNFVLGILFLAGMFCVEKRCLAATLFQENFDAFNQDWVCCLADCSLNPGLPASYSGFGSNTMSNPDCNATIVTAAARTPGANHRGYRINLVTDSWPTGENILQKQGIDSKTSFSVRWYQRDSSKAYSNFQKLWRLKQTGLGQFIIIEWQVDNGKVKMNLWDAQTASNHFFANWNMTDDYLANTWVAFEITFDLVNKTAQFYVNGVLQDTMNASWWGDGWNLDYFEIGGNQYGHIAGSTIDYDDIVLADEYIGLISAEPDTTAPAAPMGLAVQ